MALIRLQIIVYGVLLLLFYTQNLDLKFSRELVKQPLILPRYWRKSFKSIRRNNMTTLSLFYLL